MMALQLRQVRMDESWVLDKVALESGKTLENVDSISLQGTYSEKIASFGNAFKNFKNLRSLDLSRNLIFSLEGIEYLKSLQQLNLYYNNIPTTIEVARLQYLPFLKDLDLRLNPVTRNEPDYRLAVVHMLENLTTLDDREVREGERRAAKMLFTGDETSSGSRKQEGSRERDTTSFLFDEKLSTKVLSNAADDREERLQKKIQTGADRTQDDSSKKWASFAKTHNTENLLTSAPASNSTSQYRTDQRRQNELEDEYRPLPSPPRSSMRSPVKCPSSKLKGGCRVTFADSKLSDDEFLVRPIMSAGRETMFLAKGPSIGDTDSSSPSHPPAPTDSQYSYLSSTPLKKDLFRMPEAEPRSSAFGEWSKKRPEDPKSVSSENSKLREDHGEEPRNQRLLELSSDLYVTTHLENDRLLTTDDLSTDGKGFGSPSKIRSSSVEDLIRKPLSAYLTQSRPFSPIRNKDPSPRGSLSPEKRPTLTYGSPDSSSPVTGLKRAASLNTLLSSKSPSARHKDTEAGAGESTPQRSQSELETPSPVAIILRQLLDLVDRYWNGSGSLLVNQKFLSPARDLLSILMTSPSPAESSFTRTPVNPFSDEDQKLVYSRNSLGGTQEKSELLKEKLEKVMDENRTLQNQLRHFEAAASLNNSATSNVSFHHDELQRKNELLTRQLELQNEQLKQFRKLQETVNLLQDSHRSLVASNEYLLRQLNKDGSQHYLKTYQLTSGKTYSSSDLSRSTPITSLYDVGQYHKLDRLSTCPL